MTGNVIIDIDNCVTNNVTGRSCVTIRPQHPRALPEPKSPLLGTLVEENTYPLSMSLVNQESFFFSLSKNSTKETVREAYGSNPFDVNKK